ncbi:MAG TPA: LLM class F420-dependent oxidoreductase [Actinophytocola sp.]|uniref:LLM class F420-dependent oxidoreductase n=1 Tax=Actinophytocola sp. TaxID=1872138 RepID=UPI002DDCACB5|nr:LLM class F420-dependent oxidoreductase [Actinophytocola sp.]HEV2783646.1 LLM class F420-dependent oxidoreductase [Actinophytocola sp.]
MAIEIGGIGVWTVPRAWAHGALPEVAAELEDLGFGAFWLGGSPGGELRQIEELLEATKRMPIATGIANVWNDPPETLVAAYHRLTAAHPGRFLLGIGAGHHERTGRYAWPYRRLVEFLDAFDAGGVPVEHRVLAALGPRVLALAARRAAGAHPYLVTPEHTRRARVVLGPDRLLAPEQKVLLETDPGRARAAARESLALYLQLPNYTTNLRRLGYAEEDLAYGGSDRLVDDLVAWGDEDAIRARIAAHHRAGADHVAVQVLNRGSERLPAHRTLAPALLDLRR